MWQYNYFQPDELMHYGVPGMQWGRRKAKSTSGKSSSKPKKASNKKSDGLSEYQKQTKVNTKVRRVSYGAKIAGAALTVIGQNQYNQYRHNSTPGRTAAINALGYSGKALSKIGNMAITGSYVKQVSDYQKYRQSK